jgi:ABC-type transport system substrate-binding protein
MMMQSRNIAMKACRRIVLLLVVAACTLGWTHGLRAQPKPAEKDGVTRTTALRAGEVDFANLVPREQVERLTRDPQIQVFRGMDTQRIATFFNQRKAAFQDVQVRRAVMGYGIDRHAISKTALLGLAQPL